MNKPRIALVGASHWHVPLYVEGLKRLNANVCGVSDENQAYANQVATELDTISYGSFDELLEKTKPDFVFAFAEHDRMPHLAHRLIDDGIPFAMEKPVGLDYREVEELAQRAEAKNVFCSIPFVWRYSEAVTRLRSFLQHDPCIHSSFRFVSGPPQRYMHNGSPWMLDARRAGGGCMTNLGAHFIDLGLYLTRESQARVLSARHHYTYGYPVEDYSVALLTTPGGSTITLETGYAYPMDSVKQRENTWNIVSKDGFHTLTEGTLESRFNHQKHQMLSVITNSDTMYPIFVKETLNDWMKGNPPAVDLRQMALVRKILDDINEQASKNK
ncbi:Gfo/Idh/MocA family protein [Bacillus sp. MRMR6]|uniref:Gfo/Idh/MocA family protein n=1 Tax=Bacillus sp. MRMR6 TaxID=1928617 RepID=UPI0009530B2B|nr:Gfo/Idh/MocA family oxidoreductase [Bacillus sp. MRMR6]OLS33578.1 hypothetical protein BTR25_25110 [Bacillus sp. MRMR6]